jgi:uncharacterized membrane protein HdeD (DUF308 family)
MVTSVSAPRCPRQHRRRRRPVRRSRGRQPTPTYYRESEKTVNNTLGQQLSKWKLAAGVLTVLLGAVVLAWPGPTILVASTLFGVYLLVTALVELFVAFTVPWSAATRVMLFISGALSLVLAMLSFRHFGDAYAVLLLSLWIGISFIFQGISGVASGISERHMPGRGWDVVLGILSVIAGVVVLVWPFDSIGVLTIVTGIWLVISGVVKVVQSFQIRRDAKAARHTVDSVTQRMAA